MLGKSNSVYKELIPMRKKPTNLMKDKSVKNITKSSTQKGNISIALYDKLHPHRE